MLYNNELYDYVLLIYLLFEHDERDDGQIRMLEHDDEVDDEKLYVENILNCHVTLIK